MSAAGLFFALTAALLLLGSPVSADNVVRLEGQVTAVRGDGVSLSLGSQDGLRAGDEGTIAQEEVFRDGSRRRKNIARVRVTAVRPGEADATVVVSTGKLQVGQRIAFLYSGGTTRCVGALDLATMPAGTAVTVDGKTVKADGPMVLHGVPCGDHALALRPPGGEEILRTVTVARGQVARVAIEPGTASDATASTARRTAVAAPPSAAPPPAVPPPVSPSPVPPAPAALAPAPAVPPAPAAPAPPPAVSAPGPDRSATPLPPADATQEKPAVAAVPPPTSAPSSLANLVVSAWGYRGVGLAQGVLTLGLLTSQYAVEVDDRVVLGWKIGTDETAVQVAPGRHRLRVLVRNVLTQSPIALHDGVIDVRASGTNEARVNFLISTVTVNGDREAFNRLSTR